MTDFTDKASLDTFNNAIIEEFRANGGVVGGPFEGAPMIILHTVGAKSGEPRLSPLAYLTIDGKMIIVGSKAGADTNPAWFHNLVANPTVTVELGTDTFEATAKVTDEADRAHLYAERVKVMPGFGEYQEKTSRVIPVVLLDRP